MGTPRLRNAFRLVASIGLLAVGLTWAAQPPAGASGTSSVRWGLNTYVTYRCDPAGSGGVAAPSPGYWVSMAATQMAAYRSLGANSVGLAFPVYIDSATGSTVRATCTGMNYTTATPPPDQLATYVDAAHAAGLTVLLRPLLDETNFADSSTHTWRGTIAPQDPTAFMRTYASVLLQYAAMASAHHVEYFSLASELDSMATDPHWSSIIKKVKAVYPGKVSVTGNWSTPNGIVPHAGTSTGLDAYVGIPSAANIGVNATVNQMFAAWAPALPKTPVPLSKVTIDEVGIGAAAGAYQTPWVWSYPASSFNQQVQANWFSMICKAVKVYKMRGVYFWGPWAYLRGGQLMAEPSPQYIQDFQPLAQQAIRRCFTGSAS